MDFSKRKSSKASISIPPTQIPLPRASLNKLPAQLRKPNLGGRGGSHAARTAARATTKRSRAAAAARAWRPASSERRKSKGKNWADVKLALRALWLSKTLASRNRAPCCRECRLDCAKPAERPSDFKVEENPRSAGLCRRPQLRVST